MKYGNNNLHGTRQWNEAIKPSTTLNLINRYGNELMGIKSEWNRGKGSTTIDCYQLKQNPNKYFNIMVMAWSMGISEAWNDMERHESNGFKNMGDMI